MYIPLFVFTLISTISCQSVINEYCLKNVKDEFHKVLNSYKIPANFSVPDEFQEFKNLINRTRNIATKIKTVGQLENKLNDIGNKLNETRDELNLIKVAEDLLTEIKANADRLKADKNLINKTQDECQRVKDNYKLLIKDFNDQEKLYAKVNTTFGNISNDVNKINEKSLKIKQKVDELHTYYLCDENIFKSFKDTIKLALRMKNVRDYIRSQLKEVKEKLEKEKLGKKQLNQDKIFFQKVQSHIARHNELIDYKNKLKTELENISKIAFHLCKNGICNLLKIVRVEQ